MKHELGIMKHGRKLGFRRYGSRASRYFKFLFPFSFFLMLWLVLATPAFAQGVPPPSQIQTGEQIAAVPGQAGLNLPTTDPRVIVARIIRVGLGFLGLVVVALILYGGFLWMTSAGNEEQIDKAKKVLTNAIIGLAIILASFGIVQFVLNRLQRAAGGPLKIPADVRCPGPDCPFLPADAFIVRRIAPSGAVPIRNVVVRVFFSGAPDPDTLGGNLNITRKDSGEGIELEPAVVAGNIVELRPKEPCPEPNQERRCFDADTEFVVQVRDGEEGVRRFDGKDLLCGGFAPSCRVEFRSGSIIDVAPPEVTIESPDDGAAVEVDTCVPVQVRVKDDGGVEHVEIYADGALLDDGILTPPEGSYPQEIILTMPCFPANPPAPSEHQLRARAFDIDDNAVFSAPVRVMVRPSHCFNRDRFGFPLQDDDEDGPNCDSAVDGPSGCGLCDGSTCTDNIQCSGGVCMDTDGDGDRECTTPLTITGISPGDGKAGTLVTLAGLNFGNNPGAAFFHEGVRATAPAACAGVNTWSNNYILVGLPDTAQTGPVTVVADGCADNDNLCRDQSNDKRGPIVPFHPPPRGSPTPTGLFEVNEVEHPGICGVLPGAGLWNAPVVVSGVQFGHREGPANLTFAERNASITSWSEERISGNVPPAAYGATKVQVENDRGILSNSVPFEVLSPDAGTLPMITRVVCAGAPTTDSAQGGPGVGCTISGRNFGDTPGMIWFVTADGRGVQADVNFPSQCGTTWWSPTLITVKVPRILDVHDADEDGSATDLLLDPDAHIYVERYDSQQSNQKDFGLLNSESAAPFLACIEPAAGPTFTNVSIFGERFGSSPFSGRGVLFTAQRSAVEPAQLWVPTLPAALTNVGGIRSDGCPRGGWDAQEACVQVPGNTVAGVPAGEVIVQNDFLQSGGGYLTRSSNPKTFLVGDCRLPAGDSSRIDCATLGGLTCCGDGTCRSDCSNAAPGESAFAWQFTTSQALLAPQVFAGCDRGVGAEGFPQHPPSPSPSAESKRGSNTGVCINAAVAVSFNPEVPVDTTTLNAQTIKLEKCTAPTELLSGIDTTFASQNFTTTTAVWRRPPEPTLTPPTDLTHADLLQVSTVLGSGRGAQSADSGNFALKLTKLDNDTGPGWQDKRGLQQNSEHWFGYQASAIANTNGTSYSAVAYIRAADPRACGKKVGILIQRGGGNWQKEVATVEFPTQDCEGRWLELRTSINFTSTAAVIPGYVRVFLQGDPYELGEQESSGEDFAVYVDDVQIEGAACRQVESMALGSNFEAYPGGLGFRFWPQGNFSPGTWYRVALFGGRGGITAQDQGSIEGQPMIPLQDGASRCGNALAAYCFTFQTKNEPPPADNRCQVGGIAVVPSPYEATVENEQIDYSAIPVADGDPCLVLPPDDYSWAWSVSDTTKPARAVVTYKSRGASPTIGKVCREDTQCAIGRSRCSNDSNQACISNADCGGGNTCVTQSCVAGSCRYMPWTTTAVALEDTQGEELRIRAHTPPQPPRITGFAKLRIAFEDPQVLQWWPSCGEACTNAQIAAKFNVAMFTSANPAALKSVTNVQNVSLWAVPCGNGIIDQGEECDDGNNVSGDGCSELCRNEGSSFGLRCGDGRACVATSGCSFGETCAAGRCLDPGEDCDDGNLVNADGCSSQCLNEGTGPALCGNGSIDLGEECDDRNREEGDGCSAVCLREGTRSDFAVCGNSRLEAGEECEVNFDHEFSPWCNPQTCLRKGNPSVPLLCGNGSVDPGEECDPNAPLLNTPAKRNLCTNLCQWTGTRRPTASGGQGCGNGRIELGEDCDDGNLRPGDGCTESCINEGSIAAGSVPACGDGIVTPGVEDCDDGNTVFGDGCSPHCLNEGTRFARCGDNTRQWSEEYGGEDCDDGNTTSGDGCSAACLNEGTSSSICGNGVLNNGEDEGCDGGSTGSQCTDRCLKSGRPARRVLNTTLSWNANDNTLRIALPDNPGTILREDLLLPSTFYRVLLKGGNDGIYSRRRGSTAPGEPLSGLNFAYNWSGLDAVTGGPLAPGSGDCQGAGCNTFSWTFKTGAAACQVDQVELNPPQAALYLLGARQSFSADPLGAPDACDPQGQRLNPLTYDWGWSIDDPELEDNDRVADLADTTTIAGVLRKGIDRLPACGNGVREYAEDCDDGNTISGDGCSNICLNEGSSAGILGRFACGNGIPDPGEECDQPGTPWCTSSCLYRGALVRCSDGELDDNCCGNGGDPEASNGEDCDDGNVLPEDGCSPQCLWEGTSTATTCGNGQIDNGEECDPAGLQHYLGLRDAPLLAFLCDPGTCLLRGSLPVSTCGNGRVEAGEECDRLNDRKDGDGCSASCRNEGTNPPLCGNESIDRFEDCDDGNVLTGDGCSARCLNEGTVPESPRRIDPIQQARAVGIRKFCRNETGQFKEPRVICNSNLGCTDDDFPVCAPPNPWSTVAVNAEVFGQANTQGSANLTVFCVAAGESDCPAPGQGPSEMVGRGSDSCCYLRPQIVARLPGIETTDACPNGLLEVTFDQPMDQSSLDQAIGIAKRFENTAMCPEGLSMQGSAGNSVWCVDPSLSMRVAVESAVQGSRVVLQPSRILDSSTKYRIFINGDPNLNDAVASGVRSIFGVGFRAASSGVDSSWVFRTGAGICTVEDVRISVTSADQGVTIFEDATGAGFARPDEQATVHAAALSISGQELQPMSGYGWEWSWGSAVSSVVEVSNSNEADQIVTAQNRSGESDVNATARVNDASAFERPEDYLGALRDGSARFTTTLCENPWPSRQDHSGPRFEDRESAELGAGGPMNFSTWYCRDAGSTGEEEDLPALTYPGAVRIPEAPEAAGTPVTFWLFDIAAEGSAPLKEYLLVETQDKQHGLGIRVFGNPERLPILRWYAQMGFQGKPDPLASGVDGYEAVRVGNTVYIGATNVAGNDTRAIYSNIYVLSLSENAPKEMQNIFNQMIANFRLNVNLDNLKVCNDSSQRSCSNDLECNADGSIACRADQDKLRRDLLRLNHVIAIQSTLDAYRNTHGRYPTLEAGTFIRSMSTSRWPSWDATLGGALGSALPKDPLNLFAQGCQTQPGERGQFDQTTCWNEQTQTYRCPAGSHVYQYRSIGAVDYELGVDFELLYRPSPFEGAHSRLFVSGFDPEAAHLLTPSGCGWSGAAGTPPVGLWSNATAVCGNNLLETGQCVVPAEVNCDRGRCSNNSQQACATVQDCGTCANYPGVSCALNGCQEFCEIGAQEEHNYRDPGQVLCIRRSEAGQVDFERAGGNNILTCDDGGVECDRRGGSCRESPTVCMRRPTKLCLAHNDCSAQEGGCLRATACRARRSCTADCLWGRTAPQTMAWNPQIADLTECNTSAPPLCGNGIVEAGERCDDGPQNGQYGRCRTDCGAGVLASASALTAWCGDTTTNGSEVCDDGDFNGAYDHCRFDCSGLGARCGDAEVQEEHSEECEGGTRFVSGRCRAASTIVRLHNVYLGDSRSAARFATFEMFVDGVSQGLAGYNANPAQLDVLLPSGTHTVEVRYKRGISSGFFGLTLGVSISESAAPTVFTSPDAPPGDSSAIVGGWGRLILPELRPTGTTVEEDGRCRVGSWLGSWLAESCLISATPGSITYTVTVDPTVEGPTTTQQCESDVDCATIGGTCVRCGTNSSGYRTAYELSCTSSCSWQELATSATCVAIGERCGDGQVNGVEQCDDANTNDTDGCTNECRRAICDDGINQGLICTGSGDANIDGDACRRDQDCGRGRCTDPEECDESVSNGVACIPGYGLSGCTYCDGQCNIATLSGGVCGDRVRSGPEVCDGPDIAPGYLCIDLDGFSTRSPSSCSSDCRAPSCRAGERLCQPGVDCARAPVD